MPNYPFRSEAEFAGILKQYIRPAQPIDTPELLQGRDGILREVGRTLHSPGMHVFIYGERGVGKTSIALTVTKTFAKADAPYVGCDENTTFSGLVTDICNELLNQKYLKSAKDLSGTVGLNFGVFKAEAKQEGQNIFIVPENITSVNLAANVIIESAQKRGVGEHAIVIDEIDRIESKQVTSQLAELIKLLHDKRPALRKQRIPLPIAKFRTRLYSLCSPTHGDILARKRNSWYAFKENVLRGYVRLVAERNGVPLGSDHF
jgi:uncharacterized protein